MGGISRSKGALAVGVVAALCAICPAAAVANADEEANLLEAQTRLDAASARVAELEGSRELLREQVLNARQRADELDSLASGAEVEAERVANTLAAERRRAATTIQNSEEDSRQGLHDWRLQRAWALAGAVFLLFVALGSALWSKIVAWPGLARVRGRSRWLRAAVVGLVALVGLGLIGASSSGVALLGGVLVGVSAAGLLFAFAIPSEAGQASQRQSSAALRRGQIGLGVTAVVGAVALLVVAIALEKPSALPLSERTLALAEAGTPLENPTPELRDLLDVAERKRDAASAASVRLSEAMESVRRLNGRLGSARFAVNRSQRRVDGWEAAVAKPDPLPEPVPLPESTPPPATSSCDPNYSGCVPAYPPDVDCADVGGSVSVYGSDPHGLDADGDGVGCE
ncbi:MAG TPA: hypothetical protein VNM89_08240 [Solirubrobacterales bacterium]|nr:hypothetical protein [Solirubrobacterales bacterium]